MYLPLLLYVEVIFSYMTRKLLNFIFILPSFEYLTPGATLISRGLIFVIDIPTGFQEVTQIIRVT